MDGQRFDRMTKALAAGRSRRSVLKGLLGMGGAAVVGGMALSESDARIAGTRPIISAPPPPAPTPTPTPTPADPCPGLSNCAIDGCCDGTCSPQGRCCPAGRIGCGEDCCATQDQCCGGECCPDGSICIGEETCCPSASWCGGVCCTGAGQRCCGDICLQAGQCCIDDDCPDSPDTCQTGTCSNGTCQLSAVCAGSGSGSICCGGTCQECCGTDTSTCSDNKCELFTCNSGACVSGGIVLCLPNSLDRGCFSQSCNPGTGRCENDTYFGDGTACGPLTEGNGKICCNEQCIPSNESNCGSCGNVCTNDFACINNTCQCDEDTDCATGEQCCSGACLATGSDAANCGACGAVCPPGLICVDGQCKCDADEDCPPSDNLCRQPFCDETGTCQLTDTLCATTDPCQISLGCNPDAGQCDFAPKCTGGLSCIAGQCLDCDCVIDGACYQNGDQRPNNKCDHCDATVSATDWSPKTYCPASNIDCIVNFCDPSDGVCYQRVADAGATCLTPHYYEDGQCANLESPTGICKGQECHYPDIAGFCNADPFDFCQTGTGICEGGRCKAQPQNENLACDFGTCSSGRCQNGVCATFPINEGQNCSIGNPGPCRDSDGICSNGDCITFPLRDGIICNSSPGACSGHICQGGNCLTSSVPIRIGEPCGRGLTECLEGYICTASGSCQSRFPDDSFCDSSLYYCEQNVTTPGSCNGDGTCTYARFESGTIMCDSFDDPNNIFPRECCPGMLCSEPPLCQGFCVYKYCYYPEDLPDGGGIFS